MFGTISTVEEAGVFPTTRTASDTRVTAPVTGVTTVPRTTRVEYVLMAAVSNNVNPVPTPMADNTGNDQVSPTNETSLYWISPLIFCLNVSLNVSRFFSVKGRFCMTRIVIVTPVHVRAVDNTIVPRRIPLTIATEDKAVLPTTAAHPVEAQHM